MRAALVPVQIHRVTAVTLAGLALGLVGCAGIPTSTTTGASTPTEAVKEFLVAKSQGDVEKVCSLITDNAEIQIQNQAERTGKQIPNRECSGSAEVIYPGDSPQLRASAANAEIHGLKTKGTRASVSWRDISIPYEVGEEPISGRIFLKHIKGRWLITDLDVGSQSPK